MPRHEQEGPQDSDAIADRRTYHDDLERLPALIPLPRAAEILGLSRASAYRYAAAGELPVHRFGSRMYVITARIRYLIDGTEGPQA